MGGINCIVRDVVDGSTLLPSPLEAHKKPEDDTAYDSNETRDAFEKTSRPASRLELHRVLEAQLAPLSKFVGSRVELHSLTRDGLNGRHSEILPLHAQASERVPVRLDGNVPAILVKPSNIYILRPDESHASSDDEQ